MQHLVYTLYSQKFNKSYTGITSSIIERFHSHNTYGTKGWTLRYRPWVAVHIEVFNSKKEALNREKWFKSGIGRNRKQEIIKKFLKS